ncbi:MAG: alpha/beta fold hydrolase [Chloroflexota bacterium]
MGAATTTESPPDRQISHVEQSIEVDGIHVRYLEGGQGKPGSTILLLHAFQGGADLWFPYTFPALAPEHHVIALDLPGFGNSGRLPAYTTNTYANFIQAFLDALGLDKVDLVGHSMGGQIAVAVAAASPERINRLVLIASAGLPRSGPQWLANMVMMADRSAYHARLYPTVIRLALRTRNRRQGLVMLREDSIHSLLSDITAPTLVIWGARDRVVPLEHATLFARAIPQARLSIMRGSGHMPFYQKPAQFNRLILGFLRNK